MFELDIVKNKTILRDILNGRSWQHQKRNNSARLPSKMESWVQSWRPRTNRADGLVPMPFATFPLHLSKALRLPRKSDARSYEVLHLSCKIILANRQIWCSKMQPLSGNCALTSEHLWWTCLTFCSLLRKCTIPCACHAKRHLNVQKWREHVVFCTFWLKNVLCATATCTFSTSQPPKVARTCGDFNILTWKCALRHDGVHFFDLATSKSGPNP